MWANGAGASPHARPWLLLGLSMIMLSEQALGFQRLVRTRIANYEEAPVVLVEASIQLVRTYANPTQLPAVALEGGAEGKINRSRTRYMNRLNEEVPVYRVEGELGLRNRTRKEVAALQMTTIVLNAFRERVSTERQSLAEPLGSRETRTVRWSRGLPHEEVFEMFFIITAVRFTDGTVWAPNEELILLP